MAKHFHILAMLLKASFSKAYEHVAQDTAGCTLSIFRFRYFPKILNRQKGLGKVLRGTLVTYC
jgi:hypothetical protein